MTSSHEEPLFDLTPGDTQAEPLPAVSHIDMARKSSRSSEISQERLDEMADKLGNYVLAYAALGIPLEDGAQTEPSPKRHLPGKPLTYPKRGNVRDFHDGGRSDEYRGGMGAPELGSEADITMREHLHELQALRDRTVEENIRNDFEEDVISTEYVKVDAARSRAVGRYRAHIQKHYPDMDSDDVTDLLADFAETLLPPSALR